MLRSAIHSSAVRPLVASYRSACARRLHAVVADHRVGQPQTMSADWIAGLEPAALWHFFKDLTQIPRPSKHEAKVLEYLKDFATTRKLSWQQDEVGNMVIRRPGSAGGEAAPCVVIQGHIDMVCEKDPSVAHDFHTDPLTLHREGDWVKARGTTLGADNGIGVAAALALLDLPPSAKLPPLECLFTVDEETGLTGAKQISPSLLTGRTMLNLDTEDWGEVFIGCAGGGDLTLVLEVELLPPPAHAPQGAGAAAGNGTTGGDMVAYQLTLGGLLGGHSGLNIHEGRGNAVQLLGRALAAVAAAAGPEGWRLADVTGGDKRNAIARDASATVLIAAGKQQAVADAVEQLQGALLTEYGALETGLTLALTPVGGSQAEGQGQVEAVVAPTDVDRLLALLRGLPHGPLKFSHAVPGLVETSINVASLKPAPPQEGEPALPSNRRRYAIVTTTRSSLTPALEATRDVVEGLARLAGAVQVVRGKAYPGWQPNLDSPVLQVTLSEYRQVLGPGHEPKVGAIHAGLECGMLGEKYPGMDMVSFGPTIKGAHSPDERVQVSTVEPFWRLTLRVLERLAEAR